MSDYILRLKSSPLMQELRQRKAELQAKRERRANESTQRMEELQAKLERAERELEEVSEKTKRKQESQPEREERERRQRQTEVRQAQEREAPRETIETLRNEILSLQCYITKNQQKPRPGEQFFFAVHALPMQSVYNKIAELRNKISLIEREERLAPQKKREAEQERLETPEYKIRVFKHKIECQRKLYDGLLKGGHSRHTTFVVCEKKKLDQLIESFQTFLRGSCSAKEKLAGLTEEEKDLTYELMKEKEIERERRRKRDCYILNYVL